MYFDLPPRLLGRSPLPIRRARAGSHPSVSMMHGRPPLLRGLSIAGSGSKKNCSGGFSLVEIALALGITSFCLVVMLGLMSSGVTMSREATDRTTTSQIAQRLIGMAQQTDWSKKENLASSYYYFDVDGQPLQAHDTAKSVYSAYILVKDQTDLPSEGAGGGTNDYLATLRVYVVRDPARKLAGTPSGKAVDGAMKYQMSEFSALLASNGE